MSYGARRKFYNSKAWKRVKKNVWLKQNLLCNRCHKPVYVDGLSEWIPKEKRRTGIVHHKKYLDDTNVYITKDIHGEDLKKEILAQKEFSMTQYELNQHSNGTISLIGNITDDYSQQGEKFVIEIVVTSNTQIMGNTKNQFEELQKLKQRGDILYITLQDEKQNSKLVAKNIEILGC